MKTTCYSKNYNEKSEELIFRKQIFMMKEVEYTPLKRHFSVSDHSDEVRVHKKLLCDVINLLSFMLRICLSIDRLSDILDKLSIAYCFICRISSFCTINKAYTILNMCIYTKVRSEVINYLRTIDRKIKVWYDVVTLRLSIT